MICYIILTKKKKKGKERREAAFCESITAACDVLILLNGITEMHASLVRLCRQYIVCSVLEISNISLPVNSGEMAPPGASAAALLLV